MSGNPKSRNTVEPAWLSGGGTSESDSAASKQVFPGRSAPGTSQLKSEGPQPKFEPKKPMFVPKVPVKKEAPVVTAPSASSASNSDRKHESKGNGERGKKNGGKAFTVNKFTPKGKSVGFSDSHQQGNRKWVMPVGAAFFTGTNAAGTTAPSASSAIPGRTVIAAPTAGKPAVNANGATRIMRPNEAIEEAPVAKVVKSASASSFVSYQSAPESDSDDDDGDTDLNYGDPNQITNEVWPPLDYDPLAPLALPLGPRSAGMRAQLVAEPILADPLDAQALEKEQTSNLFVLQMPSDLKFETIAAKHKELSGGDSNSDGVRIGKMQLLASGKVRLITVDGRVYEVNSGMASSFVQILASMNMPAEGEASKSALETAVEGSGKSSAGNGSSKSKVSGSNNSGVKNDEQSVLDLMGSITKKLVITPAGDIGARRPRTYSITAPGAARGPGAGEYMQALGRTNYGEEEEEVVMMEG